MKSTKPRRSLHHSLLGIVTVTNDCRPEGLLRLARWRLDAHPGAEPAQNISEGVPRRFSG